MTVCIATDSFPPALGGIATFYANLAELLVKKGDKVIVLMVDTRSNPEEEDLIISESLLTKIVLRKSYAKYYSYYKQYFRPGGLDAPYWLAMGFSMRDWLLQNHTKFQIDIIDVIDYGGPGIFLIDPALPPVVITGHGSLTQYSRVNHVKKDDHFKVIIELERLSFRDADLILPYSWLNKKDLETTFQRTAHFSTAPWIFNKLNNHPVSSNERAVTIAGLQKIKGAGLLTEALAIVVEQKPGFQCEWIGMDFYTAPGNRSMALFLQKNFPSIWNQHLLWNGALEREETIKRIANASFKIVPSIFETFSYATLEAATLGKAIIITEGTGASYLFTHNKNAWIVPSNAEKLAEAILHLSEHPELCEMLGRDAKKMIEISFDEDSIYTERVDHYKKAVTARKEKATLSGVDIRFIKQYTTPLRKNYFKIRAFLKKLIKNS